MCLQWDFPPLLLCTASDVVLDLPFHSTLPRSWRDGGPVHTAGPREGRAVLVSSTGGRQWTRATSARCSHRLQTCQTCHLRQGSLDLPLLQRSLRALSSHAVCVHGPRAVGGGPFNWGKTKLPNNHKKQGLCGQLVKGEKNAGSYSPALGLHPSKDPLLPALAVVAACCAVLHHTRKSCSEGLPSLD